MTASLMTDGARPLPADAEIWTHAHPGINVRLATALPTSHDLTCAVVEGARRLDGVEIVRGRPEGMGRNFVVFDRKRDEVLFERTRIYGRVILGVDDMDAPTFVDRLRHDAFDVAALVVANIAQHVAPMRAEYGRGCALRFRDDALLTTATSALVRVVDETVMVQFRALYFLTPTSEVL